MSDVCSFDESLIVVGTGLRTLGHLTTEATAWIKRADHVPYVVTDPISEAVVTSLNSSHESLSWMYSPEIPRVETYEKMVDRVLELVRTGKRICFAAYGHPGVFAYPTHAAVHRARKEGFRARMLPGVSAEDCLFADLGIDPASSGCQSFEATDFLISRRVFDPSSHLILWQIGVLGEPHGVIQGAKAKGLPRLVESLRRFYPDDHIVYLYEASLFPSADPKIGGLPLGKLAEASFATMSTLYVPPFGSPDVDLELARELGFVKADS